MTGPSPTTTTLSLQQATELALADFQRGEFQAALYVCDQVLSAAPNAAAVWQIKGLSLIQLGTTAAGLGALQNALSLAPKDIEIAANAIECHRQAGSLDAAIQIGEAAMAIPQKSATFLGNFGIALYEAGDLDYAKSLHAKALELAPQHIASLNNLGSIARDQKDAGLAESYYRKALAAQPTYQEGYANLVTLLIEMDRLEDAQSTLTTLFSLNPQHAEGLRCQTRLCMARSEWDAAERYIQRAIQINPDEVRNYTQLSQIMIDKNQPDLALAAAEKALQCDAESELALHQMGVVQSSMSTTEAAMEWYQKALDKKPDFAPSLQGIAQLYMELGERDTARTHFEKARALDPSDTSPIVGLSRIAKIRSEDDEVFQALEAFLPEADAMSSGKQIAYRFALGDCYDSLKRYDEAFAQYDIATRLKRATISYDADLYDQKVDAIIKTFTPDFLDSLKPHANPSARPIFVLGMPRSGTTMTESILASHSKVTGAGELNDLQHLFQFDAQGGPESYPASLMHLTPKAVASRLATYLDKLTAIDGQIAHVTDKMPSNFHLLGLIHALFPNAKIIHTRRNAMDICLSCFTRHFDRSQLQSYSQIEQGRFYQGYARLMRHWDAVLPETAFMTVDYEATVADPQTTIQDMLAFCDLEWEDACLNFHASKRRVRTASITQVRQPVYTSSVEKWRNYASHLGPLAEVLGVEI